jgi:hypothetical protein
MQQKIALQPSWPGATAASGSATRPVPPAATTPDRGTHLGQRQVPRKQIP